MLQVVTRVQRVRKEVGVGSSTSEELVYHFEHSLYPYNTPFSVRQKHRGGGGELSKNFRELMQYSAEDRKAENFVPLAGNMYRYFGLGIVEDWGE